MSRRIAHHCLGNRMSTCQYWVVKRNRYCTFRCKPSAKYCGNHQPAGEGRIACPACCGIFASRELENHLARCPKHNVQLQQHQVCSSCRARARVVSNISGTVMQQCCRVNRNATSLGAMPAAVIWAGQLEGGCQWGTLPHAPGIKVLEPAATALTSRMSCCADWRGPTRRSGHLQQLAFACLFAVRPPRLKGLQSEE